MAPKIIQAAIILMDIGKNVATSDEKDQKPFFKEAQECASRIIERKIMSQGNNLLGVILLGSKATNNNMAEQCQGAFRNIELLYELQSPNWQMIRNLPTEPSKRRGDWIDSLIVAADYYKNVFSGVKLTSKKIILMTNFKSATCLEDSDIEQVMNGFAEEKIEVDIIGIDVLDDTLEGRDIEIARKLLQVTNGATASFDLAMSYLLFNRKKAVKACPWNVDLSIGPNIKIPVSSYIRLKDETVVKKWIRSVKDPVTMKASTTEGIIKTKVHVDTDNQAEVSASDVIKGYHYGQKIIPFSDCDKSLLYEPGDKSLNVYGFTLSSNISWQACKGDSLFYVFGRNGDKRAQHAVRCLVECLQEMKLVGLVRRVYNNGNAPKMYTLMPVIDNDNYICLSMIEVCYREEIKYMTFPSTNLKTCTNEQVAAFTDLIAAMDLTKAYDDTFDENEAFPIAETVSPSVQYILDCIAFRAMNPNKPLPPPRDDIMMLFKVPPMIAKRAKEPLDKLKKLFTLTKIEKVQRDKKITNPEITDLVNQNVDIKPIEINECLLTVKLPVVNSNIISKIGTIDPISDFKSLIDSGKNFIELCSEMVAVIENIAYCNLDGTYSKTLSAIKSFREECIKIDPNPYNQWLLRFKKALDDRKKVDLLSLIAENKVDLILKEENASSLLDSVQSKESQLYENDTQADVTELKVDTEIDNLFDEM